MYVIFHGQGTYTWPDGRKYVGAYKEGERHGQGTYSFVYGDEFEGEWKEGIPIGQGTFTWSNGDKYAGEYKVGFPWNGALTNKDGNIMSKWVNGE